MAAGSDAGLRISAFVGVKLASDSRRNGGTPGEFGAMTVTVAFCRPDSTAPGGLNYNYFQTLPLHCYPQNRLDRRGISVWVPPLLHARRCVEQVHGAWAPPEFSS
jgi:hypothetical protein